AMARMPYGIVYKNDLPDHWPNYSKFTHTPFGNYNYTLFNPKAVHYFIRHTRHGASLRADYYQARPYVSAIRPNFKIWLKPTRRVYF
ncbi:MAG: hypothetical protein K2J28_02770, partial [Duncaniella sp.]|nr:hypothetical protein [Duncaniella sp.]